MLCDAPAPATLSKKSHNSLEKQNKKQQKSTYLIEIHTNQQQQQQQIQENAKQIPKGLVF